ncbi:MAG: hypothetical protein IT364_24525 [Candidatus Hydrogenedentes bacterium]|nr:hypothetical protein [Candidatus Hydrogenedentota bacterium]
MPKKNTAFSVSLSLYKSDGTLITNPGTITAKISKDFGDYGDVGTVTEEDSTYGQIKLALTATEMNADVIDLYVVDNTSGCVPWTATIYTDANTIGEVKTDTAAILADTGTDGVKVSAGTGAGQLDFTSGVVKSNLAQILGTALTETAGYLAAGFKKFFNIASPTSTMNQITLVDTCTANTDMRGTDNAALASELAKVPKSDGGTTWNATAVSQMQSGLATSTEVTAIQNNTRVVRVVPTVIERPDSGTVTHRIELLLYDATGNMEAPDSAPTIDLVDQGGTDLSARLDSTTMSLVSTGRYRAVYTASDTDDLEQLVWTFSVVEGGATRQYGNTSLIVDTTAVDFTAADRLKLEALNSDWTDGGRLDLLIDALIARVGAITGSGDNTVLGFFKAALNKAAATPSDIGGTFAPSTDSLEALRDTEPMGTAMRGTDGANTTTPPTAATIRSEVDSNSTQLALLKKLLEADMFVDTSNPAQYVLRIREKGTTTDLLVKNLQSITGAAITNTTTIVGGEIQAA